MARRKLNANQPVTNEEPTILFNTEESTNSKASTPTSIVNALDELLDKTRHCELKEEFFVCVKPITDYLESKLDLSPFQQMVVAMLIDAGKPLSWRNFGSFLSCSRLKVMTYTEEMEDLVKKRWIRNAATHDMDGTFEGFALERGVVTACRKNEVFVPRKIKGLTITEFVDYMTDIMPGAMENDNNAFECTEPLIEELIDSNPHLPVSQLALRLNANIHEKAFLAVIMNDHLNFRNLYNEGIEYTHLNHLFPFRREVRQMLREMKNGSHPFIKDGYVEFKSDQGFADCETYLLTTKGKEELFKDYQFDDSTTQKKNLANIASLVKHSSVKEKKLFYNERESSMIDKLSTLLSDDNLKAVQERMEANGLRKGFACLFYGAPGTGKTETVNQLARLTHRDIYPVNISTLRNKFVGESEKSIKSIFVNYKKMCKQYNESGIPIPILLFNEADAIFGTRIEGTEHAVDKMENAIQNIILEELESLEGILIATTNLSVNLDKAFERRFIYKIEFQKPNADTKTLIWQSMLTDISHEDARYLADHYDFSGGQIENVNRKKVVDYILTGVVPSLEQLKSYCDDELLASKKKEVAHINGFGK